MLDHIGAFDSDMMEYKWSLLSRLAKEFYVRSQIMCRRILLDSYEIMLFMSADDYLHTASTAYDTTTVLFFRDRYVKEWNVFYSCLCI